jgi:hypothetical protein
MSLHPELVRDFKFESKQLTIRLLELLEACEGDFSRVANLEEFGQTVDRIMGGAASLNLLFETPNERITLITNYSELCKAVGYKASQIKDNPQFYDICVALLLDATETLDVMIDMADSEDQMSGLKELISTTFLERLKWVSNQFGADVRATVGVDSNSSKLGQVDIDELMRKLGL